MRIPCIFALKIALIFTRVFALFLRVVQQKAQRDATTQARLSPPVVFARSSL